MVVNINSSIDIKRRKLREEQSRERPDPKRIKKFEESIARHKKEMKKKNKRRLGRQKIMRRKANSRKARR